jgi:alkanesulfonate monooxygenase SsuD/methylene tetrahydromethanopterin reductase-like flavin-dependent oxidoreductase (luciferase family)
LSTNLVPFTTVAEHWKTYAAGAADSNLPEPDRSRWSVSRSVFIGDSDEEAMDFALNSALGRSFTYILKLLAMTNMTSLVKQDPSMPDSSVNTEYMLKQLCIIGTPETAKRRIEELWETTGGFGTLLMIAHDWDDKARWHKSMDLLKQLQPKLPSL